MPRQIAVHRFYWNVGKVGDGKGHSNKLSVKLLWEPRDLWIGAYWTADGPNHWLLYICILPMLPIRLHWARSWGGRYI